MTADPVTVSRELSGSTSSEAVLEAYAHSIMNTFGLPKRVFVRGEGCSVWMRTDGDTWTCFPVLRSMPLVTPTRPSCLP